MSTLPNLGEEHLESGTASPEVVVNANDDALDYAMNGYIAINFSSDADYTLSTSGNNPQEWQYGVIELTDTGVVLTTGRNVIVPDNERVYNFRNSTAQTLTIKTSAGTGVDVDAGNSAQVHCDGTNVEDLLAGAGSGIENVVDDTTPQLGGQLDVNGFGLGDGTLELLTFTETGSAVNHVNLTNSATGNAPLISAAGDDTNINLNLAGKGTGQVQISSAYTLPASDGTSGQALVTDGSGGVTFGAPAASASVLDMPTLSKSADYTVVGGDQGYLIKADASSAVVTITLLSAATAGDGFTIAVKKMDATNNVIVDGDGSETIDGATTQTLTTQYDTLLIQCDGSSWNIISEPASGGGGDTLPVVDSTSIVEGSADGTKELRIEVDGLTTSTTRVWTAQDVDLTVAGTDVNQEYTAAQRAEITTLTDGTTITPNFNDSNWFDVTINGSRTLANPTNLTAGQSGVIYVSKTSSGDSLAYGTYWPTDLDDFSGMSTSETGAIYYSVISSTAIDASTKYPVGP